MRRRRTDPQDSDFRDERGSGISVAFNGHTKWVVSVVSGFIVLALSAMIWADWTDTKDTARRNEMSIAVIKSNLDQIQVSLEEIKLAIKEKK